jgi:hypothetical protein
MAGCPSATLGWWGPDGFTRLVVATADPATLPDKATWYLATNLPRPGSPREAASAHPPFADNPPQQHVPAPRPEPGRGERGPAHRPAATAVLAPGAPRDTRLAFPLDRAATLLERLVERAPAAAVTSPDELTRRRPRPAPLSPELTNYR